MTASPDPALGLAEKVLTLLDQGLFTATYKYAVFLALLDLAMEKTTSTGKAPGVLTTRELAGKVLELYWPHTVPYPYHDECSVLLQNWGARDAQAEIVTLIGRFRQDGLADPTTTLYRARLSVPQAFEMLLRRIEWKLIEMPLPRLQFIGNRYEPFLYDIAWDTGVRQPPVTRYQRGDKDAFDNRIRLQSGVGEHLVRLNGLLRPLLHRQWATAVARINRLPEARLEAFLFGTTRIPTEALRPHLQELQEGRCFYCRKRLLQSRREPLQVDHFIPWARYPDDGIDNLVVAHGRCNQHKRDFLAASQHVEHWLERFGPGGQASFLADTAKTAGWESHPHTTLGVAASLYLRLPAGADLWVRGKQFEPLDPSEVQSAFASVP